MPLINISIGYRYSAVDVLYFIYMHIHRIDIVVYYMSSTQPGHTTHMMSYFMNKVIMTLLC